MDKIKEKIDNLIKKKSFTEKIDGGMDLKEDLGIDSLRLVELVAEMECAFGIELEMSDLDPDLLRTVDSLRAVIMKYAGDDENAVSVPEKEDGEIS